MSVRTDATIGQLIIQSILISRINQLRVTYFPQLGVYAKEVCHIEYDITRIDKSEKLPIKDYEQLLN